VFLAVAGLVVILDQISKEIVRQTLAVGQRWPGAESPLSRWFTVTHVGNTGVSFGMAQGRSEVLSLLSLGIIVVLLWYRRQVPPGARWLNVALGLLVGGALGNLVDRLRIGHVTDFLDFQFWPVFNVADSAIFLGVCLLTWHLWRDDRRPKERAPGDEAEQGTPSQQPSG